MFVLEENWPSVAAQGDKRLPAVEMNFQFILDISTITTVVTRGIFIQPVQIKRVNWWEGRGVRFWATHIQFMLDKDWYMVWNYCEIIHSVVLTRSQSFQEQVGRGTKLANRLWSRHLHSWVASWARCSLSKCSKWGQQLQLHLWSINPATQRGAPRDPGGGWGGGGGVIHVHPPLPNSSILVICSKWHDTYVPQIFTHSFMRGSF